MTGPRSSPGSTIAYSTRSSEPGTTHAFFSYRSGASTCSRQLRAQLHLCADVPRAFTLVSTRLKSPRSPASRWHFAQARVYLLQLRAHLFKRRVQPLGIRWMSGARPRSGASVQAAPLVVAAYALQRRGHGAFELCLPLFGGGEGFAQAGFGLLVLGASAVRRRKPMRCSSVCMVRWDCCAISPRSARTASIMSSVCSSVARLSV